MPVAGKSCALSPLFTDPNITHTPEPPALKPWRQPAPQHYYFNLSGFHVYVELLIYNHDVQEKL